MMETKKDLKMYILIKDTTPANVAPLIAAHVATGTLNKFLDKPLMKEWIASPLFKKVICKVSPDEFEKAKSLGNHFALTEVHHQELGELGLGFEIIEEYPKFFKFLPLYKI